MKRYQVVSEVDVHEGKVELKCHFVNKTEIPGRLASVTLYIKGEQVIIGKIERQVRGRFGVETLVLGVDALSPVNKVYEHKRPFWFTGRIEKVRFDFGRSTEERIDLKLAVD
jgi:hypothetical protein